LAQYLRGTLRQVSPDGIEAETSLRGPIKTLAFSARRPRGYPGRALTLRAHPKDLCGNDEIVLRAFVRA
jgi:hypothetical protein